MTNLTSLEIAALKALGNEGLDAMGGNQYSDLLDDNMACMFPKEVAKALNITLQAVGGVMSSLQQKGLTSWDEISDGRDGYWLTDAGINALDSLKGDLATETKVEEKETKMTQTANFIVKITSALGLSFDAPIFAADAAAAIREARAAVKLAGISRKVGTINFRAVKA